MKREKINKEAAKWVKEGIISSEQKEQILSNYPVRDRSFILMSFAGLFIGLGFLTFIASNWGEVPNWLKMGLILLSMAAFYSTGYSMYNKKSPSAGASFLVIGLLIFGSGLFLAGQMYNYLFFSAVPFVIWALAGFVLYIIFKHPFIFLISIMILTIGQIYSGTVYGQFNWWLCVLLLAGFGHYTYHYASRLYGYLFAVSFAVHALVLTFAGEQPYYWLISYALILYLLGDAAHRTPLKRPFQAFGLGGAFLIALFQLFFMTEILYWSDLEMGWIFLIVWLLIIGLSIAVKLKNADAEHFLDYTLYLPVIYLGIVDILSLVLLLVFSIGWLLVGYQKDDEEKIIIGTISLLIITVSAYSHFAWDFMDKSLFFFLGGILLFLLSFFLEKRRRDWRKKGTGEMGQ